MKEFAISEWQRAVRTLNSAMMLRESDPDSAASRAYYAAFHALTAMFALRGQFFNKHSALRTAVHRELIKTSQWPQELGAAYDFLIEMREVGDYGGPAGVSVSDAQMAIDKAELIVNAVKHDCPELE